MGTNLNELLNGQINYHTDAGHGWLEIPISVLRELKIADKISAYSYKKSNIAYLEEDNDAATFLKAVANLTGKNAKDLNFNTINVDDSIIRTYNGY